MTGRNGTVPSDVTQPDIHNRSPFTGNPIFTMSNDPKPTHNPDLEDDDEEEDDRIPMADEEDANESGSDKEKAEGDGGQTSTPEDPGAGRLAGADGPESLTSINILDGDDLSHEEQEEKARLIAQVLELQNTLDDLSSRVDNVKEENLRYN